MASSQILKDKYAQARWTELAKPLQAGAKANAKISQQ